MKSGYISRVQQDWKNKQRYQIYLEDELAFSVHEDILIAYNLFTGTYIDEQKWTEIVLKEERNNAYLAAIRLLSFRPRTGSQIEQALIQKGYPVQLAKEVRSRCEQEGYVNDANYAKQWISERLRLKPRGKHVLRLELQQKGIDRKIIDLALQEVGQNDELIAARKLVEKQIRRTPPPLDLKAEQKLLMSLARKGFSHETIQVLRRELREGN